MGGWDQAGAIAAVDTVVHVYVALGHGVVFGMVTAGRAQYVSAVFAVKLAARVVGSQVYGAGLSEVDAVAADESIVSGASMLIKDIRLLSSSNSN